MSDIRLEFELNKSWSLTLWLLVLHTIALYVIVTLKIFWWLALVLIAMVVISLSYYLYHYALLSSSNAVISLVNLTNGKWLLKTKAGKIYQAYLRSNSVRTKRILILNFAIENKYLPKSVLIIADALSQHQLRHLRKILYIQSIPKKS